MKEIKKSPFIIFLKINVGLIFITLMVHTFSKKIDFLDIVPNTMVKEVVKLDNSFNNVEFYTQESYKKPIVIKFYASWCNPCKKMAPIFDEVAKECEQTHLFISVNIDEESDSADFYGIKSIPTIIIIKNGIIVDRIIGMNDKEALKARITKNYE